MSVGEEYTISRNKNGLYDLHITRDGEQPQNIKNLKFKSAVAIIERESNREVSER